MCGYAQAVNVSSACVAVGCKLGFDSVDCTISQAVLGALDFGLDCVIADCMPAGFLVAHLGVLLSPHTSCMYFNSGEILMRRQQSNAARNRPVGYISWALRRQLIIVQVNKPCQIRSRSRNFLPVVSAGDVYAKNQVPAQDGRRNTIKALVSRGHGAGIGCTALDETDASTLGTGRTVM